MCRISLLSFPKWCAQGGGVTLRIVCALVLALQLCRSSFKFTDAGGCPFAFVCGTDLFSRLKTASLPLLAGNSFRSVLYEQISYGECHARIQSASFSSHHSSVGFSGNGGRTSMSVWSCGEEGVWSWEPQSEAARCNGRLLWDAALELQQEVQGHFTSISVDLKPGNQQYVFKSKKNGICNRA